jgi:flagellar hook assembly protein FlgD
VRSFPNPFSPATTLSFSIARPESVLVEIYDPAGRLVRLLRPGLLGAGGHGIPWDGRDELGQRLPSGVFFYRLRTAGEVHGGTLVLVR